MAFLLVILGLTFKIRTGGIFKISEKARQEVVQYELYKRKFDLTTTSLSQSCKDLNQLVFNIKSDLINYNYNNECVSQFYKEIEYMPDDSILLLVMYKLHDNAVFKENQILERGVLLKIFGKNQSNCKNHLVMILENYTMSNVKLIVDIKNFADFLACHCDSI
jgi:hypothetical protein